MQNQIKKRNKEAYTKIIIIVLITGIGILGILLLTQNAKADGTWSDTFSDDSKVEELEDVVIINNNVELKSLIETFDSPPSTKKIDGSYNTFKHENDKMKYKSQRDASTTWQAMTITPEGNTYHFEYDITPTSSNFQAEFQIRGNIGFTDDDEASLDTYGRPEEEFLGVDILHQNPDNLRKIRLKAEIGSKELTGTYFTYTHNEVYQVIIEYNSETGKYNAEIRDSKNNLKDNVDGTLEAGFSPYRFGVGGCRSTGPSNQYVEGYIDNLTISKAQNGYIKSKEILLPFNCVWDYIYVNKNESGSDNKITISVLDANTNTEIPGFKDLTKKEISLLSLEKDEYPRIKLLANFQGDGSQTPLLEDWSMEWEFLPEPILYVSTNNTFRNVEIIYNAFLSYDSDGTVELYKYNFGDEDITDWTSSSIITHKYSNVGIYNISLKVKDNKGFESNWSKSIQIVIKNRAPIPQLEVKTTETHIIFDASKSSDEDGKVIEYKFDFGDGTITKWLSKSTTTYTYKDLGTFSARVKVKDDNGEESNWSIEINITIDNIVPIAIIDTPKNNEKFTTNQEIKFNATSSSDADGDKLTYKWVSSIDGTLYEGKDSSFTKKLSEGNHTITLTVMDTHGAKNETKIDIEVLKESNSENGETSGEKIKSTVINPLFLGLIGCIIVLIGVIFYMNKQKSEDVSKIPSPLPPQGPGRISYNYPATSPQQQSKDLYWPSPSIEPQRNLMKNIPHEEITIKCPVCNNMINVVSTGQPLEIKCPYCGAEGNVNI